MDNPNNFKTIKLYSIVKDDETSVLEWACKCGNSKLVFDPFHDEVFCLNCGGIIKQGNKHFNQLKSRKIK